jgi:hypothetical protein
MALVHLIAPEGFNASQGEVDFEVKPGIGDTVLLNTQFGRESFRIELILHGPASDGLSMKCFALLRKADGAIPEALALRCAGSA